MAISRRHRDGWVVDWLSALRHSGHVVSWSGSPPALALAAEALPDPGGDVRIDVAAPERRRRPCATMAARSTACSVAGFGASVVTPVVIGPSSRAPAGRGAGSRARFVDDAIGRRDRQCGLGREVHRLRARGTRMAGDRAVRRRAKRRRRARRARDSNVARRGSGRDRSSFSRRPTRSSDLYDPAGGSFSRARRAHRPRFARSHPALSARAPSACSKRPTRCDSARRVSILSRLSSAGAIALERRADGISLAARRVGAGRVSRSDTTTAGVGEWPARRAPSERIASGGRASSAPSPTLRVPPRGCDTGLGERAAGRLVDRLGRAHEPRLAVVAGRSILAYSSRRL